MFDYAIKNGLIVDGTRRDGYQASVYLKDGLIAAICSDELPSQKIIDVWGKVVAPGFIDLHTHSDVAAFCAPNFESAVYQGVTFHVAGNCGFSVVPNSPATHNSLFRSRSALYYVNPLTGHESVADDVRSYGSAIRDRSIPIHLGLLVGHSALRGEVIGRENRPPTGTELQQMQELLDENLSQGALGLSLGLTYAPSSYGQVDEFIALAKVVATHDGILAVHMRHEDGKVFDAVEEMLTVARATHVKLHISHLKVMWKPQWGKAGELLELLDRGRAEGLRITADQYPYLASSTGLQGLLPAFAKRGTAEEFVARFEDPVIYEQIREAVEEGIAMRGGPATTTVANTRGRLPEADGKHLGQLAEMWGITPADAYCRVLHQCAGAASGVFHCMSLDDVLTIMKRMDVAVGSDGYAQDFITGQILGRPHPRSFGTFPRFIQTVRENNLMRLEDAVYKMTGLPARILGLSDVGTVQVGASADITVFDCDAVEDCSTFQNPTVKPKGIEDVFVAGKPVLLHGVQTTERNGRLIVR